MPARGASLIRVTCSTVGTGGPLSVGAAVSDYRDFSHFPDGSVVNYAIEDTPGNETGWGLVGGGGTTLTRNFIDSSTGSLLSLTGGAQVIDTLLPRDLSEVHAMNNAILGGI